MGIPGSAGGGLGALSLHSAKYAHPNCKCEVWIRMIGSGIPINQSRAPLPKPMTASMILTDRITRRVFEGSLQRQLMSDFSTQDPERDFRGRRPLFVRSAVPSIQPEYADLQFR